MNLRKNIKRLSTAELVEKENDQTRTIQLYDSKLATATEGTARIFVKYVNKLRVSRPHWCQEEL